MNLASNPAARGNRLVVGLLAVAGFCTGGVGIAVFLALKFGRWPRTTLSRFVVFAAAGFGTVGAVGGLIVGMTYPPTAAFAVVEIGLPSVVAGALVGLLLGSLTLGIKGLLQYRRGRLG